MTGIGGTPISIPEEGKFAGPGVMYVARCRIGYGDSGRTAGGASDGCHVWADTAGQVDLFRINPLAAADSDGHTSGSNTGPWGGVTVYSVFTIVKVACVGLTALDISDTAIAGDCGWELSTDIVPGTTGVARGLAYAAVTSPAYGWGVGMGPVTYLTTDTLQNRITATLAGDLSAGIVDVYCIYSLADEQNLPNSDWPDTLGS